MSSLDFCLKIVRINGESRFGGWGVQMSSSEYCAGFLFRIDQTDFSSFLLGVFGTKGAFNTNLE